MTAVGTIDVLASPSYNDSALVPTDPRPPLRAIIAHAARSLAIDCVAPAVLFSLAMAIVNIFAALIVALVWTCGATYWRWATGRRASGLLMLTIAVMAVRTAVTLATGNTFVYFLQPVFANAAVAVAFFVSLATAKPVVARLAGDFYPLELGVAARPRVRSLFWRLTLMWGVVCLAKGVVTLWLLESQTRADFVMLKNAAITTMTVLAVAATIWLSAVVAREEGLIARG